MTISWRDMGYSSTTAKINAAEKGLQNFYIILAIMFVIDLFFIVKITENYKILCNGTIPCCFDRDVDIYNDSDDKFKRIKDDYDFSDEPIRYKPMTGEQEVEMARAQEMNNYADQQNEIERLKRENALL